MHQTSWDDSGGGRSNFLQIELEPIRTPLSPERSAIRKYQVFKGLQGSVTSEDSWVCGIDAKKKYSMKWVNI